MNIQKNAYNTFSTNNFNTGNFIRLMKAGTDNSTQVPTVQPQVTAQPQAQVETPKQPEVAQAPAPAQTTAPVEVQETVCEAPATTETAENNYSEVHVYHHHQHHNHFHRCCHHHHNMFHNPEYQTRYIGAFSGYMGQNDRSFVFY